MLCGLIMYIAIFKSEVGSKLRPKSQLQPPVFEYRYGYSFILYVVGSIFTQFSGISCIFLYIHRTRYKWKRKQLENYKRGKRALPPTNFSPIDSTTVYPCRRHPNAYINSNSAVQYVTHQKRYYFTKEMPTSPCSIHHQSRSNSLRDVAAFYNLQPPPSISYHFTDRSDLRHCRIPRDATTNTVSTTADLSCDEYLSEPFDDYSPSIQHEHEFVTFDLDQTLPLRAPSICSINSRKLYNGTDSLRRTTPV